MRPVFLRIDPTFDSSFLGWVVDFVCGVGIVGAVFAAAGFLAGATTGCVAPAGLGSSSFGDSEGGATGVGLTTGAGFAVVVAVTGGSIVGAGPGRVDTK